MALDARSRNHIKALAEEFTRGLANEPGPDHAKLFLSGTVTGLGAAVQIADGAPAEKAAEDIATRLTASIGQAYLDGKLSTLPGQEQAAPVNWQAIAERRERELKTVGEQKHAAEQERDGAYRERARLVALIAGGLAEQAVVAPATDVDEPGWQILYATLHGRQCSWHFSPRDADLVEHFEHVPVDDPRAQWDGHTTDAKYQHIDFLARALGTPGPFRTS